MEKASCQLNIGGCTVSGSEKGDNNGRCIKVRMKIKHLPLFEVNKDNICAIFNVDFKKIVKSCVNNDKQYCEIFFNMNAAVDSSSISSANRGEIPTQLQSYLETLATTEAEDSSYDSDGENDEGSTHHQSRRATSTSVLLEHEQVSRTTSDTLGQEFAEYVNTTKQSISPTSQQDRSPGYTARVEFALKLGYTERLVQAALARLGPDPAQNELLAELIKLGAQYVSKGEFTCDSPTAECSLSPSAVGATGSTAAPSSNSCATSKINDGSHLQQTLNTASSNFNIVAPGEDYITVVVGPAMQSINCLRSIVVDGSNLAMSHGNKEIFSCRGIKLCVDWFKNRGHKDITVFVPKWRKESSRPDNPIIDQEVLNDLERERMLVFTPSRLVGGKRMVCYDDRYILKLAAENDGIVVSNDNYRDLVQESSEFKKVVEERVLMYSFVNDRFMPPDDPLGRSGPTLDNFLRTQPKKSDPPPPCPYGKKCTYGNKCKFNHPERGSGPQKSVTERLSEHAARHLSARNSVTESARTPVQGKSLSVPLSSSSSTTKSCCGDTSRKALCRTRSGASDFPIEENISNGLSESSIGQHSASKAAWEPAVGRASDMQQHHVGFLKSHSIENISHETFVHHPQMVAVGGHGNYPPSLWGPSQLSIDQGTVVALSQQPTSSMENSDESSINLHRKLRRQLTLSPAGCDPRIYQMQRCLNSKQNSVTTNSSNTLSPCSGASQLHSPHKPLVSSLSGPRSLHPRQWDLHQSVTRIASAPDPSRPWHTGPPPASSSEPHINLWPHHAPPTVLAAQDQRRRLHYHLASIFPEEQVQTVMQMYPDEINPQTICAAILSMFPKI